MARRYRSMGRSRPGHGEGFERWLSCALLVHVNALLALRWVEEVAAHSVDLTALAVDSEATVSLDLLDDEPPAKAATAAQGPAAAAAASCARAHRQLGDPSHSPSPPTSRRTSCSDALSAAARRQALAQGHGSGATPTHALALAQALAPSPASASHTAAEGMRVSGSRTRSRRKTFKPSRTKGKTARSVDGNKGRRVFVLGKDANPNRKTNARCERIYSINCP